MTLDRGDRVGILSLNSARHFELWFAIPAAGLVMNDLNFRLAVEELRFICDDSGIRVLFVDDTFLETGRVLIEICDSLDALGVLPVGVGAEPVARVESHVERAGRASLLLDGEAPDQVALGAKQLVVAGRRLGDSLQLFERSPEMS